MFKHKAAFQAYNTKLQAISTEAMEEVAEDNKKGWHFMTENPGLTLLAKNATRPEEFFLLHHCGVTGESIMGENRQSVAFAEYEKATAPVTVLLKPLFARVSTRYRKT